MRAHVEHGILGGQRHATAESALQQLLSVLTESRVNVEFHTVEAAPFARDAQWLVFEEAMGTQWGVSGAVIDELLSHHCWDAKLTILRYLASENHDSRKTDEDAAERKLARGFDYATPLHQYRIHCSINGSVSTLWYAETSDAHFCQAIETGKEYADCRVCLGAVQLTLKEVLSLRRGMSVAIETRSRFPVVLQLQGEDWFAAEAEMNDGKLSLLVTDTLKQPSFHRSKETFFAHER